MKNAQIYVLFSPKSQTSFNLVLLALRFMRCGPQGGKLLNQGSLHGFLAWEHFLANECVNCLFIMIYMNAFGFWSVCLSS